MKIQGQYKLPVPQQKAYDALMDPDMLARTLPGCEALEPVGPDEYKMKMKVALAAMQGLFEGKVKLEDANPPTGYTLKVEGKGRIGFINGGGSFTLEPDGENETTVNYEGDVKVGGMIAGVGSRLLDMTSKMMIKRFFSSLTKELEKSSGA